MKRLINVLFISIILAGSAYGQNSDANQNKHEIEVWYVWIDSEINKENQTYRLVSKEPIKITCCVSSSKFRKFNRKAEKWIRKNYDENFRTQDQVFQSLQHLELAMEMVAKAKKSAEHLVEVDYKDTCD